MFDMFRLQQLREDVVEKLTSSLAAMEVEMRKVYEIGGLPHFQAIQQEVRTTHRAGVDHPRGGGRPPTVHG